MFNFHSNGSAQRQQQQKEEHKEENKTKCRSNKETAVRVEKVEGKFLLEVLLERVQVVRKGKYRLWKAVAEFPVAKG